MAFTAYPAEGWVKLLKLMHSTMSSLKLSHTNCKVIQIEDIEREGKLVVAKFTF